MVVEMITPGLVQLLIYLPPGLSVYGGCRIVDLGKFFKWSVFQSIDHTERKEVSFSLTVKIRPIL